MQLQVSGLDDDDIDANHETSRYATEYTEEYFDNYPTDKYKYHHKGYYNGKNNHNGDASRVGDFGDDDYEDYDYPNRHQQLARRYPVIIHS